MKRIIVVLILSVAMIAAISELSFGGENKDVTVFGVTLGKSLEDSKIPECNYTTSKSSFGGKYYDFGSYDCYRIEDIGSSCFTMLKKILSFNAEIYLTLENKCNRQSPVHEIQVEFNTDDYAKLLLLVRNKFGRPTKTDKSVVQNRMGASFTKFTDKWDLKGCSVYLSNRESTIDRGFLSIEHPDKTRNDVKKIGNEIKSDSDKF